MVRDNALPGGNSAAAELLLRLGLLTGERSYEEAGLAALRLVRDAMGRASTGFGHALCALDLALGPAREVAVVGGAQDPATAALARQATTSRYRPNVVTAVGDPTDPEGGATVPLLRERPLVDGRAAAYVCERFACQLPVVDPSDLARRLDTLSA